jgi:type II secretory pathway predicted ATPase ExeA
MYLEHFQLTAQPFRLTPDIGFLFMSEAHTRAKSYMDYTVWNQEGFVVITGEIGSGKTTLIQKLLSELGEDVLVAKVFQTQLDEVEFLQVVLAEFGLEAFAAKKAELLDMLNGFLLKRFQQRRQIVLIVDDAHNLSMKVLEEIRMLAGLETGKEKVFHVILVGQPQLDEILDHPGMDQLRQRVKLRYRISALNDEEIGAYIRHRLGVVGGKDRTLFPPDTLPLINAYTGGIPRLINTLCDMALTCAYADGLPEVTPDAMESAIKELQWPSYAERIERHRLKARSAAPADNGVVEILREQSAVLAAIAGQGEKVEHLASALESIGRSLAAIELHLRNLVPKQGAELRWESTIDRRKKTG